MCCIGEIAKESPEICGIVCSVRKSQDRIAIWLSSGDKEKCEAIGASFKDACQLDAKDMIKFEMHPRE